MLSWWRSGSTGRAVAAGALAAGLLACLGAGQSLAAAQAGTPQEAAQLLAGDGVNGDAFGTAVAISQTGDVAVVGAPRHNGAAGAVYVFTRHRTGWVQSAELTASDAADGYTFGTAVAISPDGDTLLIGAPGNDSSAGAVYVFTAGRSGWRQSAELTASDAASNAYFGLSVAFSANTDSFVVGANGAGVMAGEAYVFTRQFTGWRQTAELTPADGSAFDDFGVSVAISANGQTVLAGAANSVYAFAQQGPGWRQSAVLTSSDLAFGLAVAISADGDAAFVADVAAGGNDGAVDVYARQRAGWTQTATLTASDAASSDGFGHSVAVSPDGREVLVGSPLADSEIGAAYAFVLHGTSWSQTAELIPVQGVADDDFGDSVGLSASTGTALAGAPTFTNTLGAAYVFTGLPG